MSVLHLVTSTNGNGYSHALQKSWQAMGLKFDHVPAQSSLSEARAKVSFDYFKAIFENDLKRLDPERKTYRGHYLYATDGDDLVLPCSKDILSEGFRGYRFSKEFETHYPKMYTSFSYDILNGRVQHFRYSTKSTELQRGLALIPELEQNSITVYDRLYGGYPVMSLHLKHGSHFIVRLKCNGKNIPHVVRDFLASKKAEAIVEWRDCQKIEEPIQVRLVKCIRGQKVMLFATSLGADFTAREVRSIFRKRWEIETAFRDITSTLKIEQWHSKKLNGILQEIYALLWFINAIKMQMKLASVERLNQKVYLRSNLKLCAKIMIDNIGLLLARKSAQFHKLLDYWIKRSREKRTRDSRSYPRVIKGKQSKFPLHTKTPRRPAP